MKGKFNSKLLMMAMILVMVPINAAAQWTFDVVSVEAYIQDHKTQRSLLLARSTFEQSNKLLHDYTQTATGDYKQINVDLDKYTRAFDVIDILYQSLRTVMNVKDTYSNVSGRIKDYKKLIDDYNKKVLQRGKPDVADLQLITINEKAIENIYSEGTHLYRSLNDLILYATGAAACSTADLLVILESINISLDNIERHLNSAYFESWRYIQVRIGYWKAQLYRTKTKAEILDEAFGRWKVAGKLDY
jgi:hypothetical protein